MKITEQVFRKLLREESRRSRIFEATDAPAEQGASVGAATNPQQVAANAATAAQGANAVSAVAGAAGQNPGAQLNKKSKDVLLYRLSDFGMTGLKAETATPQTLVAKYIEFLETGVMNADLWFGEGQYPAGFNDQNKKKFQKYFVDKWNENALWNRVQTETGLAPELINLLDSDEQPGGFDDFTRYTGQWNDTVGQEIQDVHNAFVNLKKLLPGTPNIDANSLKANAPTQPTDDSKAPTAEAPPPEAKNAGEGAAAKKPAAPGLKYVPEVVTLQSMIGMPKEQQDGKWGPTTQAAFKPWLTALLKKNIVVTLSDGTKFDNTTTDFSRLTDKWKDNAKQVATINNVPTPGGFNPTVKGMLDFIARLQAPAGSVRPGGLGAAPTAAPAAAGAQKENSWRRGARINESDRRVKINWGR